MTAPSTSAPSSAGEVRPNPTSRETVREPKATPPEGLKKGCPTCLETPGEVWDDSLGAFAICSCSPSEGSQARTTVLPVKLEFAEYQLIRDALAQSEGAFSVVAGVPKLRKWINPHGLAMVRDRIGLARATLHESLERRYDELEASSCSMSGHWFQSLRASWVLT